MLTTDSHHPAAIPYLGAVRTRKSPPATENSDAEQWLRATCETELTERGSPAEASNRLSHELDMICELGFAELYLALSDIHSVAVQQGHLAIAGGTAPCSLVVHLLGISPVDPLHHRLVFETHLNRERNVAPIIGLSISGLGDNVLKYARERFGELPREDESRDYRAYQQLQESGAPRSSQASIDILSKTHSLTLLQQAARRINSSHSTSAIPDFLPTDDSTTWDLFGAGDTAGIPYCGSQPFRDLLRQTEPQSLSDLIATFALHQSSLQPNQHVVESYIDKGRSNRWKSEISEAWRILAETRGEILYWEQVDELLYRVAGWEVREWRELRQFLRQNDAAGLQRLTAKFIASASDLGHATDNAADLLAEIIDRLPKTVCKAAIVSQAYLAYQLGFLKSHYPQEYDVLPQESLSPHT